MVITGIVQRGRQLGRTLGFPTANVALPEGCTARFGVYATRTQMSDGREFTGVGNVGIKPTFGETAPLLEVFLFGFDEDIYDQAITTELVGYLREERRFASLDELVAQLRQDAEAAVQLHAARS